MRCKRCGYQLGEDALFCSKCGETTELGLLVLYAYEQIQHEKVNEETPKPSWLSSTTLSLIKWFMLFVLLPFELSLLIFRSIKIALLLGAVLLLGFIITSAITIFESANKHPHEENNAEINMDTNPSRMYGWYWFQSENHYRFDANKCGKWMHFFSDQEAAIRICQEAIAEKVCDECKCSDLQTTGASSGVICFYTNGDDIETHKRILAFMLKNNLIRKTKTGKLYNISFKYDTQTENNEYNKDFSAKIKLSDFVNLETGEFLK